MGTFRYVVADVFTDTPLAGNPVAVFTDGRGLGEEQMQRLARELNLSETTFLDSTALGVLIGTVKRLRSRDGRLTIVNVDQNIAKTFEITGLDQIFTILGTRDEAVAALDAATPQS